jgi:hypothetical protein
MIERAFDQRVRAGLAVFLEQVLLEAAAVDADADRTAIGLGGAHHLGDARAAADIARVDPQAGRAGIGGFQRALVVEMDVGDDRHVRAAHDLSQRRGRFDVGTGDADDVDPRLLAPPDLIERRADIGRRRIGHRLHGDRGVATHGNVADHDLAARTADDIAPRT